MAEAELSHTARWFFEGKAHTVELTDAALVVRDGERCIPYGDIEILHAWRRRVFRVRGAPGWGLLGYEDAVTFLRGRFPGRIVISAQHYPGRNVKWESRADSYRPLIAALAARVLAANPHLVIRVGPPRSTWISHLLQALITGLFAALGIYLVAATRFDPVATIFALLACGLLLQSGWLLVRHGLPRRATIDGLRRELQKA